MHLCHVKITHTVPFCVWTPGSKHTEAARTLPSFRLPLRKVYILYVYPKYIICILCVYYIHICLCLLCMYMYVYIYTYTYICIYTYIYIYTYIPIYIYMYVYTWFSIGLKRVATLRKPLHQKQCLCYVIQCFRMYTQFQMVLQSPKMWQHCFLLECGMFTKVCQCYTMYPRFKIALQCSYFLYRQRRYRLYSLCLSLCACVCVELHAEGQGACSDAKP